MKRRLLLTCSVWLLPLLLLRLMLPAGYMLDASGGTLRIVVCAGALAPLLNAASADATAHANHTHHSHHDHAQSGSPVGSTPAPTWHGDVSCPFAQLGAALPGMAGISVAHAERLALQVFTPADPSRASAVPQHQPIRGPPIPS